MSWIAEHEVVWVFPSGERRPGKIAIGQPELVKTENGERMECTYVLEGLRGVDARERRSIGGDSFAALYYAFQAVGFELYLHFAHGMRVLYPAEGSEPEDPEADTARLLGMLGPLVRAHGNPRGVADPEGKLAELEALVEEERRRWEPEENEAG